MPQERLHRSQLRAHGIENRCVILHESAIVDFRMAQYFLDVIPFLAPSFFLNRECDGQRQTVQTILNLGNRMRPSG